MTFITDHPEGSTITVRVTPNASRNALAWNQTRGVLEVKVAAAPREGKANTELLRFLGKAMGVPRTCLRIIRGASTRDKAILVAGLPAETLRQRLQDRLSEGC